MPSGHEAQHLLGDIQPPKFGLRLLLVEDAREAAFAAAHIEHALAAQFAQMLADQFDMINARVDGGREMLFIARGFVEGGLNARAQLAVVSCAPLAASEKRRAFRTNVQTL